MITVFTPTYNRAHLLPKLYESLCKQTFKNFEWLIIDDGSSDNTTSIVDGFIKENKIIIRYTKQPNGGKHRAINHGVQEAKGELFFIVDSDDSLTPDAIEWIHNESKNIVDDRFAGLSGLRIHPNGNKIGGGDKFGIIETDAISIRDKYKVRGDLAEIYKTKVLKNYPFPDIEGEKFCSEGLVWGRIAERYIMRYVYHGIYVCEYLSNGLTDNSIKNRFNSPNYAMLAYSEMARHPKSSVKNRIKHKINFWIYSKKSSKNFSEKLKMIGLSSIIYYPLALLIRLKYKQYDT